MVYDVFICYETTTGRGAAKNLHKSLKKGKINAFFDRESILSGDDWKKKVDSAIEESQFFVKADFDPERKTIDSEEVKRECKKALDMNKNIITSRYSGLPISHTHELSKLSSN